MTSIFDDPADFSDDALDGFVAAHRRYVDRVDGGVVRSTEMSPGQVALVVGGGSGHYPAFAGLVGPGIAAGSACGNIFASPSAGQIYRVARAADTGGGVLLCYGNYAGDVLHFGQAQKRLNDEGIDTRTVLVTDDIASATDSNRQQRRGIAGGLAVYKIAGAAAEAGLNIDEVERLARKANEHTRTLGVAFAGCTLPGAAAPLFSVPSGKMSLGMGIHGEPGISDLDRMPASELAQLLVGKLLAERPATAGSTVVPLLNGLGTVKYEELFLLYGKIETLLTEQGFVVTEPECGELVTSLDMSGLSLTLLWPDEELAGYWAAPADTPAFRKGNQPSRPHRNLEAVTDIVVEDEDRTAASVQLGSKAAAALDAVRLIVVKNEEDWGRLDAFAGDGDHGIGMRRGADAAADAALASSGAGVRTVLCRAGDAWSEKAGGTSGALWGAALTAMAKALGNKDSYSRQDAGSAVSAFASAIVDLGQAEIGDKTMVDAILPFAQVFAAEIGRGASVATAMSTASAAAQSAAAGTADLRPKKGRARPLAEKSIGHPDPGAVSFAMIAAGVAEFMQLPTDADYLSTHL